MMRTIVLLAVAALLLPATSVADILLDQQPDGTFSFIDQELNGDPLSSFIVDDLTISSLSGMGVEVQRVTTYFNQVAPNDVADFLALSNGFLNIIDNDGTLDTEVLPLTPVTISVSEISAGLFAISADVSVNLADGDYWIGLTPQGGVQGLHLTSTSTNGDQAHIRNPSGVLFPGWEGVSAFGQGSFDISITVEGVEIVPEPSTATLLALGLAGMVVRRRR